MSLRTRTRRSAKAASITLGFVWRPTEGPSSLPVQQLSCSPSSVPPDPRVLRDPAAQQADLPAWWEPLVPKGPWVQPAPMGLSDPLVQRAHLEHQESRDRLEAKETQAHKELPDQPDPKASKDCKETKEALAQPDTLELQVPKEVKEALVELDQQAALDRVALKVLRDRLDLVARAVQLGLRVQLQDRQAARGSPVRPARSPDLRAALGSPARPAQ